MTSHAFQAIRPGAMVAIVDRFGAVRKGRAIFMGPAGWVLNMGGAHGTPGIATPENVRYVRTPARDGFTRQAQIIHGGSK